MLVDSHAHLTDAKFARDLPRVLARARDSAVTRVVSIADDLASARRALALARRTPGVWATAGVHPEHQDRYKLEEEPELRALAREEKIVAIGEIGLDFYHPGFDRERQIEMMTRQAAIAAELGLPMAVHCRSAYAELIELFEREKSIASRGVVHCFSGTLADAKRLLDQGFFLGVGGSCTYPNAKELRETIKAIGLARVMLETDSPYLPPQCKRGRRNEPSFMKYTALAVGEALGLSFFEVAETTTRNAGELFKIPFEESGVERLACAGEAAAIFPVEGGAPDDALARAENACRGRAEAAIRRDARPGHAPESAIELGRALRNRGIRARLVTDGRELARGAEPAAGAMLGAFDAATILMNPPEVLADTPAEDPTFPAMIEFARLAAREIPDVRLRAAARRGTNIEAYRKIAEDELRLPFEIAAEEKA